MCVLLLVCSPAMTLRGNLAIIIDRNSDTILAEELKSNLDYLQKCHQATSLSLT